MKQVNTTVLWSPEDEGFIAVADDLPGTSAFGATQAEALVELLAAIQGLDRSGEEGWKSYPRTVGQEPKDTVK